MIDEHDAFISYSHSADATLAPALEKGLERLARPFLRLRAIDVFRDQTSLSAQPELWGGIVEHVSRSRWLLVLASPALAASRWCTQEVLWWLEHRPRERLLIALTDGELVWDATANDFDWQRTTALSPQLRGRFTGEPLYVDLRTLRDVPALNLDHHAFRSAVLDLAATIRGIPKDQLDGEDVRQLRRTRWIVRSGVAAIATFAVVAVWQAYVAIEQRNEARLQARIALSQRVAADARRQPDDRIDRALLLTVAADKLQRTPEAEQALLTSLLRTRLQRIDRGDGQPASADASAAAPAAGPSDASCPSAQLLPADDLAAVAADADFSRAVCHRRSPDGQRIAAFVASPATTTAARVPARFVVWDRVAGARSDWSSIHFSQIRALASSPDGTAFASADAEGVVSLWHGDSQGWRPERLANPSGQLTSLDFEASGEALVGQTATGDRLHWGVRSSQALARVLDDQRVSAIAQMGFVRVAFVSGGGLAASNGIDGHVLRWDLDDAQSRGRELMRLRNPVRALAATRNGEWLAAASEDEIRVVHLPSGLEQTAAASCKGLSGGGLALSDDGRLLVVGGIGGCLRLWRFSDNGEPVGLVLPGAERARVYAASVTGDGGALLLGGTFGLAQWRLAGDRLDGSPQYFLPRMLVTKLAVSKRHGLLAAGTWSGEVWLASAGGDKPPRLLGRHSGGAVLGLAFSPGADLLVSIGAVGAGSVWDVRRAEPLLQDLRTAGAVATTDMAFSEDGRFMAAGSTNRVLSVWPMNVDAWHAKACEIAGRELTPDEWTAYLPGVPRQQLCKPAATRAE